MDKEWGPELPDYDIYTAPPGATNFCPVYRLRTNATQLDGNFLVNDNLVSVDFLKLCEQCQVRSIRIPVEASLLKENLRKNIIFYWIILRFLINKNLAIRFLRTLYQLYWTRQKFKGLIKHIIIRLVYLL